MSEKRFHKFGLWVIDNPSFNGISIADLVDTELMSITEVVDKLNKQQSTIKQLQRKCFELEKDYLIETSDISDKIYLEDEIKKLKKEYGVDDE